MRRVLLALALIASSAPVMGQQSAWDKKEGAFGAVYSCGKACSDEAMQCSREIVPNSVGISLDDLVASSTWEQFDYYFLAEIAQRRQDRGVIGGKRIAGPEIVVRDGVEWLVSAFSLESTSEPALTGRAVLWVGDAGIEGLKCSFVPTGSEDNLIQSLIGTLGDR